MHTSIKSICLFSIAWPSMVFMLGQLNIAKLCRGNAQPQNGNVGWGGRARGGRIG